MSTHRALGLFDQDTRHRKLESLGDPLVVLNRIIPCEIFREPLEAARPTKDRSKGGRPPYDAVLMFKILVLRELYALSDEQVEFQVADRLSFQRFVGIGIEHPVPDYTAVWRFRERLKGEPIQALFDRLNALIEAAGFKASQGQMLDARNEARSAAQDVSSYASWLQSCVDAGDLADDCRPQRLVRTIASGPDEIIEM